MFVHSFSLGLQNANIKIEMKAYVDNKAMSDEELFEKVNVCVSVTRWSDYRNVVHS